MVYGFRRSVGVEFFGDVFDHWSLSEIFSIVPTLRVGMHPLTLCVLNQFNTTDQWQPNLPDRLYRSHAPRGNASLDALRLESVQYHGSMAIKPS